MYIQILMIFVSFKKAIRDSENDDHDDFLKVREKTAEEKVINVWFINVTFVMMDARMNKS